LIQKVGLALAEFAPRWEWRTFGRHFGKAEDLLAAFGSTSVHESDEVYFLTTRGDNVKVRDGLMDVKVLHKVDAGGLEQWSPVLKAGFPLSAADATNVLGALQVPLSGALEGTFTYDEFVERFIGKNSGVRVVNVHKRRTRYTIDGCMAELSDITANGKTTRTIAVESEDPVAVTRAVSSLGLNGYVNTSYPHGLAALLDNAPDRYAVIDVGTNSVKFHIGERDAAGQMRTVADFAEVTRLGEGLADAGVIGAAPLERTVLAIAGMVEKAKREGVRAIAAAGTAGLRIASNSTSAIETIRNRTGLTVEVISGEEEARLAFVAARSGLGATAGTLVVFDTGGGSSQFTFGTGSDVEERFSVNVGAAIYTERFRLDQAISGAVLQEALDAIQADLSRLKDRSVPDILVGMGGAITNIAAVKHGLAKYDPDIVQGTVLDRAEIDRQIELYRCRDANARRTIVGLQPKRAEVILAGACIVRTVMEMLGKNSLTVSDRGLRHGLLAERFGNVVGNA
jgi:exopolyphosphatase/guanosine-5'-triphosphate,3'-diphosphate pyrophosphatase